MGDGDLVRGCNTEQTPRSGRRFIRNRGGQRRGPGAVCTHTSDRASEAAVRHRRIQAQAPPAGGDLGQGLGVQVFHMEGRESAGSRCDGSGFIDTMPGIVALRPSVGATRRSARPFGGQATSFSEVSAADGGRGAGERLRQTCWGRPLATALLLDWGRNSWAPWSHSAVGMGSKSENAREGEAPSAAAQGVHRVRSKKRPMHGMKGSGSGQATLAARSRPGPVKAVRWPGRVGGKAGRRG